MNVKSRITSIIKSDCLDVSEIGIQTFNLLELHLPADQVFQLPSNLRLGHLAEKIVAELIRSSTNYELLYENVQLIEDKKTIGELDFIVKNTKSKALIHIELAYKFYLLDPSISGENINNWIGPNRNDSLVKKIEKLKAKQFPLLYHQSTISKLDDIDIDEVSQALCLLVSLFVPYKYQKKLSPNYENAVKGYYLNIETFIALDNPEKFYCIPPKKEWGIDPSENENWLVFKEVESDVRKHIVEKKAPLCWQKHQGSYLAYFIIWW